MLPKPKPYIERDFWELLYIGWCLTQEGVALPADLREALLHHKVDPDGF